MKLRHLALLASVAAAGIGSQSVRADSIDLSFAGKVGNTYTYNVYVSGGTNVRVNQSSLGSDSYFTVYDIAGFVPGSAVFTMNSAFDLAGFDYTLTTPSTGVVPPGTLPTDTGADNVYVQFKGDDAAAHTYGSSVNSPIGTLSFDSTNPLASFADLTYTGYYYNGTTKAGNISSVPGPSAVPLPAAAWGGMGLLGVLGGLQALRRRAMRQA